MRCRKWWLLCLLLVPATWPSGGVSAPATPRPAETLRVAFLDVGQGDAALVQIPGGTSLLIDGGPSEAGPRVLVALRAAGVSKLSWLIASHPHEDHLGGLIDVLREIAPARALDSGYVHGTALQRTYLTLLKRAGTKVTRARAGQAFDLGSGARLEILAPGEGKLASGEDNANNHSIVARLAFGGVRFLFTGDMGEAERRVLMDRTPPERLRARVLKVAHHGSHAGTDAAFLQAVRPEYAVVSAGRENDYGHPHPETLAALEKSGARLLRTDRLGTIVFTSDGKTVTLQGAPGGSDPAIGKSPEPSPGATFQGPVIGNLRSKAYHAPGCGSLPKERNRKPFKSAREAEEAGYRAHAACVR